jgi:hypothetical protein
VNDWNRLWGAYAAQRPKEACLLVQVRALIRLSNRHRSRLMGLHLGRPILPGPWPCRRYPSTGSAGPTRVRCGRCELCPRKLLPARAGRRSHRRFILNTRRPSRRCRAPAPRPRRTPSLPRVCRPSDRRFTPRTRWACRSSGLAVAFPNQRSPCPPNDPNQRLHGAEAGPNGEPKKETPGRRLLRVPNQSPNKLRHKPDATRGGNPRQQDQARG